MHTTTLRNGTVVSAWPNGDAKKYSSKKQAEQAATKCGGHVYHAFPASLVYYVRPPQGSLGLLSNKNNG